MEITDIRPRRKGLSQLYLDGEAAVKLDTQIVLQEGLRLGMELTDDALYELIQKSDHRRATEKALYLLEFRARSKKELQDRITQSAVPAEAAAQAVNRMEELGLVNDEAYARQLAETLFSYKHYGPRRVRQNLVQKGIERTLIDEILMDYEDFDTVGSAREILLRKYPGYQEDEKIRRRAYGGLQRLGYGYAEIKAAMQATDWDDE